MTFTVRKKYKSWYNQEKKHSGRGSFVLTLKLFYRFREHHFVSILKLKGATTWLISLKSLA